MAIWIFLAGGIAMAAFTLRMWMEFQQRARQLNSETEHARNLISNHKETLALAEEKIDSLKKDTEDFLSERNEFEQEVLAKRAQLTSLEERLERTRPAKFRVDKDDDDEESIF